MYTQESGYKQDKTHQSINQTLDLGSKLIRDKNRVDRLFSENFSDTGGRIRRIARTVGKAAVAFIGFIGWLVGWTLLIISVLTMISLFVWYAFNQFNFLGMENPIIFPPLEILSNGQALIAATFGFLGMGIPFLALFLWLVRILFKTEKMNNYMTVSILAIWLVSVVGVIYYCVDTPQDFREKSTISVQREIDVRAVYHFSERDIRVLDGNERDSPEAKFNIRIGNVRIDAKNFRKQLRSDIGIFFESVDSLARPHIQYRYSAEGRTYDIAAQRAADIVYEAIPEGNTLLFPSHFLLKTGHLDRNQRVNATVFLPIGSKVVLHRAIRHKLWDIPYRNCLENYENHEHQKATKWKMTKTGLVCSPPIGE